MEACRGDTVLGKLGEKVRLKWPNDLYAVTGAADGDRKKIGGILVNTSFTGNEVEIVIGMSSSHAVMDPLPTLTLGD